MSIFRTGPKPTMVSAPLLGGGKVKVRITPQLKNLLPGETGARLLIGKQEITLPKYGTFSIGSSSACDIRITGTQPISALIELRGPGNITVSDLINGEFVIRGQKGQIKQGTTDPQTEETFNLSCKESLLVPIRGKTVRDTIKYLEIKILPPKSLVSNASEALPVVQKPAIESVSPETALCRAEKTAVVAGSADEKLTLYLNQVKEAEKLEDRVSLVFASMATVGGLGILGSELISISTILPPWLSTAYSLLAFFMLAFGVIGGRDISILIKAKTKLIDQLLPLAAKDLAEALEKIDAEERTEILELMEEKDPIKAALISRLIANIMENHAEPAAIGPIEQAELTIDPEDSFTATAIPANQGVKEPTPSRQPKAKQKQ
ncbi:MAG: hypothetical protein PHH14_02165 [Candidatus Margulisbacteria bacterium]|nr:hypothetical protein [Candidatus Margulisiibacteriota bacterium]